MKLYLINSTDVKLRDFTMRIGRSLRTGMPVTEEQCFDVSVSNGRMYFRNLQGKGFAAKVTDMYNVPMYEVTIERALIRTPATVVKTASGNTHVFRKEEDVMSVRWI